MENVNNVLKNRKTGDKDARTELPLLERIIEGLGEAKPVRAQGLEEEELEMIKELTLLTAKPSLYVANILKMKYLITLPTNM